jgi:hypothetical protein
MVYENNTLKYADLLSRQEIKNIFFFVEERLAKRQQICFNQLFMRFSFKVGT